MLHGCSQDAEALAASSRMNTIADRERFFVLYPEQDRLSNMQGCWNGYDTRMGWAQAEAHSIGAAIEQVCLLQGVDRSRVALAGISAGAGMAVLMATRQPERFRAIAMHSWIARGSSLCILRVSMAPGEAVLVDWKRRICRSCCHLRA